MSPVAGMSRAAVFLDRDGTINTDVGYLADPDELELIPGAAEAVRILNREGLAVIIVTNQSGVARGFFDTARAVEINGRLVEMLNDAGASVDAVYFCPHHPDDGCGCRKPAAGLVERAAEELGVDPESSYVVGDKASDIGLAENSGATGVLVLTGEGRATAGSVVVKPAFVAEGLLEAAGWIIADTRRKKAADPPGMRGRSL